MELVEYNKEHTTPHTPTKVANSVDTPSRVGFGIDLWHWFNKWAAKVMAVMVALVTIATLDLAHNTFIVSVFLVVILASIVTDELVTNVYPIIKRMLSR
jgi:hypothetical protein